MMWDIDFAVELKNLSFTLKGTSKIVFFRDCGVSVVLESSYIPLYTAVLRAPLPCTHVKIRIFRDALKLSGYLLNRCRINSLYQIASWSYGFRL